MLRNASGSSKTRILYSKQNGERIDISSSIWKSGLSSVHGRLEDRDTVNFGYNDARPGKQKRSLCAKCHYIRSTHVMALCTHVWMDTEFCVCFTCVTWCRPYHTSMHMYNVIYQHTCGCTACWRTTLACFSQARALSHGFLARVDWFAVRFSSMAMLKLSNWSTCRYIRSDLGPLGTKYVSLFRSVVTQDVIIPEGFCVVVNGEKFWARNQIHYKRYVVIPDVVISEVFCKWWELDRRILSCHQTHHLFFISGQISQLVSLYRLYTSWLVFIHVE